MDSFTQRKREVLSKEDKSSIGEWDEKTLKVCEKINSFEDYYTTSSCSGRIMILKDSLEKRPDLFEFVSHSKCSLKDFLEEVKKVSGKKGDFKFKQESVILHVACRNLESAKSFLKKSKLAGFKNSGVISLGKNIVVEIKSTEKIEFPLVGGGDVFVGENFLKIVLNKANYNLERGWKKIERLEEFL